MTIRVLYVDDEDDIREVAQMALELDPELEVRSCASGREALEIVPRWQPDLILLDVMMPVMDGPTTLARLRECPDTSRIPVIFITARTQPGEVKHFLSLGGAGVLAKPFDPITLSAQVRALLEP